MNQPNVKAEMIKMLDALPDELTWGDLQYHIYVRQKIERGMQAVEAGRTFSQEEVEKHFEGLMKKWR
jgi:predicted transcriptional regulator